jgi:hypothetical protein
MSIKNWVGTKLEEKDYNPCECVHQHTYKNITVLWLEDLGTNKIMAMRADKLESNLESLKQDKALTDWK